MQQTTFGNLNLGDEFHFGKWDGGMSASNAEPNVHKRYIKRTDRTYQEQDSLQTFTVGSVSARTWPTGRRGIFGYHED